MNSIVSWQVDGPTDGPGSTTVRAALPCDDPRRLLTHASLYLWRQWRLYGLPAWEDALGILHRARHDVEEEDDALFLETLDGFLKDATVNVTPIDQEPAARKIARAA